MRNNRNQSELDINHKLATLLTVIVSFQQKIEILKVKLCGHPNFSPELYYKQIDRCQKGFISSQDFITFVKKSKPQFNIDSRYLRSLFKKLNQDDQVIPDRLTYFGYLNVIKPYFQTKLARDLLMRDSVAAGQQINLVTKKLLEQLLCTIYVCVAQHQRVKQLIILGDVQEGGLNYGNLYNIYQLLNFITEGGKPEVSQNQNINIQQSEQLNPNIGSISSQRQLNGSIINKAASRSSINSRKINDKSLLHTIYNFIIRNSEYQVQRQDMRYLLAYLSCHQYMLTQQKYLSLLFMPVISSIQINKAQQYSRINKTSQPINQNSTQINFLNYVHPGPPNQTLNKNRQRKPIINKNIALQKPVQKNQRQQHKNEPMKSNLNLKNIDQEPRILLNVRESTIQTPILQRFLRQSKVMKNMSRYPIENDEAIQQQFSAQSSAFIHQSTYQQMSRNKQPSSKLQNQYVDPNQITGQNNEKQQAFNFNLEDVLSNNSNLQRSQYYQNLSLRARIKDEPLLPSQLKNANIRSNNNENAGILNQFMLR